MSEPQNKLKPSPETSKDTGPRLTQAFDPAVAPLAELPVDDGVLAGGTKLKIVTISPGRASYADTELGTGQQSSSSRRDPYLGATIDGRYKVEAVLGEGGMGIVYRCTHTIIGKKVAMKVLRADLARDGEVTERFLNEAKAASAIGNPHIIDISDFGQFADGATYFVMEFLSGSPLSKAVEGGQAVPLQRIVHIASQLAEGLAAAHESGIVHRDLKPDNIYLIDRGGAKDFVKILDFGIAKVSTTGEGKLTRAGAVFGTPHYMSPEQAAGAPVDHRGDVYSLGVILYELASGRVPFDADNFMGILTQHMYKAPVPMRALVPAPADVPPGLEAIVLKCLSKRPEDRYQTMHELLVDLQALGQGKVPSAVNEMMARSNGFNVPADYFKVQMPAPMPASPLSVPTKSRWPLVAGLAGVGAAVVLVLAIFAKSNASTAAPSAVAPEKPPVVAAPTPVEAPAVPAPVAAAPTSKSVALAVEPIDAHVFNGSTDLGTSPVMVDVPNGKTLELEVRRAGYKTGKVFLDGSEARKVLSLDRIPGRAAPRVPAKPDKPATPSTPAKKKPSVGGGDIVNPWG
ncbi:MAG: serine/threonine-protein kinase [Polyangiaceae bacterium]